MMAKAAVKPIPEGMHSLTPHLICAGAADAIEFYKKAFNAVDLARLPGPDGKLMHAAVRIGDSTLMLVDENPQWGALGPKALKGSPVTIHLYVERRRRHSGAGGRCGRKDHHAGRGHVLGRSIWTARRPVRPSLVGCDAYARFERRGNQARHGQDGRPSKRRAAWCPVES